MESITIKVEESFAKEMESAMKPDYSTKTEFIREAIRDKIKIIRKEKIDKELLNLFGKSKSKTALKENEIIKEKAGKELAKKLGIKLN